MYNMFFGRRKKLQLNKAETTYKVHYLGNVMTSLIKGGYHHGQKTRQKSASQSDELFSDEKSSKLSFNDGEDSLSVIDDDDDYTNTDTDSCVSLTSNKISKENLATNLNKRFNNIVCNVDKPVKILWDNHLKHNGHAGLKMKLTITQGGLRVDTKDHGLTEYYGHRIHFIQSNPIHPKLFIWVYQHVGKNLKTEIRCHAALCHTVRDSRAIENLLNERLQRTFLEYKREKRRMQNSRLCNSKNGLLAGQFGTRKRSFRSTKNYKPPVQHGMSSAPKLDDVIEEEEELVDERAIDTCKNNELENCNQIHLQTLNEIVEDEEAEESEEETGEVDEEIILNDEDALKISPVTEQLILSSSSSSSSSESSSPMHSNLSSPSLNENKQLTNVNITSFSSSSSSSSSSSDSSHSNELNHLNYSDQTYSEELGIENTLDDSPNDHNFLVECNKNSKLKKKPLIDQDLVDGFKSSEENQKCYTEVSYDFLGDRLSDICTKDTKTNLAHSKSFSSNNSSYQLTSLIDSLTIQAKPSINSFYNPFRRTNISKSFSTFTTRFKQQQKQKTVDVFNFQEKLKTNCDHVNEINLKKIFLKSQMRSSIDNGSPIKNLSDSTSSPLSSPDLSTSSSSSLNSSVLNNNNNMKASQSILCESNDN